MTSKAQNNRREAWEQDFVVFSHVSVREEEITELLPKNIARTVRIQIVD